MLGFQLVSLTLPGWTEPSIPIAASRAGGVGVLNLEGARDPHVARQAIVQMIRHADVRVGIRLDSLDHGLLDMILADLPTPVKLVILTSGDMEALPGHVRVLHEQGRSIWLEVANVDQAKLAAAYGVDGLIAKGHEASGWVGDETTFVLLQRLLSEVHLPIWAQGGIGLHTAAACFAAGAAGVVLDAQLALTRESQLPEPVKAAIAAMDGSETICLGTDLGLPFRVYARRGSATVDRLQTLANTLSGGTRAAEHGAREWHAAVDASIGWDSAQQIWPLGQDAAFAAALGQRYRTVGGVFAAIRQAVSGHVEMAQALRPLDEGAPLAQSHGTRYPIIQGPMTRVSDTAPFALSVAEGGGLPFLALALMRAPEVDALLAETQSLLGDRPWGVGILGFVPPHLRQEQMEVIRKYRPRFALIAGGRPDQAHVLEQDGIPSYLHVPSPGLLRLFLNDGTRRFVFEGRECGGHVGPRSSFVLWNTMVDVLLEAVPPGEAQHCHILFAGGIHDALSASMVATLAAPLVERGIRVGVLMGTSYLFTQEAVVAGAIMPGFQEEAVRCQRTALLETGPGHATRCAETTFVESFRREKQRLMITGESSEELRSALEDLNLGRLRIASKGINRHPHFGQDPEAPKFITVADEEQRREGMYMIGQVAALRDQVCTVEELHREVSIAGTERLRELAATSAERDASRHEERASDVAVVGMSCILPKAPDVQAYWENILNKVDAITEIPSDRWDWKRHFDPDRKARDKIYSRWGGFLEDVAFDPTKYGIPPNALRSIEPIQLLVLEAVRSALGDAGYEDRPFPREHTSVILGAGGGAGALGEQYSMRAGLPELLEEVPTEILDQLPEWTEDSFPGILLNVIAGRVANRFDLGGVNYTVDAACASSLAATYLAVRELESGTSDVVITGGVDNVQNPFGFMCFSKTQALSPRGHCRTFDDTADGIAISEGVTIVVLKRLADAERDGDRIYAVIKGVAGSSDGRDRSLTAPRPEGQARAMERAYAKAGVSPATVTLIEAHGTGTLVGDQAELETLKGVFSASGAAQQGCAIGSVKSMIGHTKCAAGVAGLMKVALALHHKVLPATLGVERPNTKAGLGESPLYVNSETRPWLNSVYGHPRRAGVSAFGFGGTNFHAVLEEYTNSFLPAPPVAQSWPSELFLWSAPSRGELIMALTSLEKALAPSARPELQDLAYALYEAYKAQDAAPNLRLAIVATSSDDLRSKLTTARAVLDSVAPLNLQDPRGIYCTETPLASYGKVAFLFPGQGSQYPNMLRDLAVAFPEVRETFERADQTLFNRFGQALSQYVFPIPAFGPEDERAQQERLTATNVAQPALGAADMAVVRLLQALGIEPELLAGHSYGEYVALCAAGAMDEATLATLSEARGRSIIEAAQHDLGTMAAVQADPASIAALLEGIEGVWIANLNAPQQTMISGTRTAVAAAVERLKAAKIGAKPISVACAFHSPIVAPAQERLGEALTRAPLTAPRVEVFSNTTAAPYPRAPEAIAGLLAEHLVQPVRFTDEIEAMYTAGARVFVEVGPRNVLTGLVRQILDARPHIAIAVDAPARPGLTQLQHALAQLAVHGAPLELERLFRGRLTRPKLNLARLAEETADKPLPPTTWLINGGRSRPMHEPKAPPHHPVKLVQPGKEREAKERMVTGPERNSSPSSATNGHVPSMAQVATPVSSPPAPAAMNGSTNGKQHQVAGSTTDRIVSPPPQSVPPTTAPMPLGDGSGSVMLQFQGLMNHFLETQRNVMLSYLQGTQGSPPAQAIEQASPQLTASPSPIVQPTAQSTFDTQVSMSSLSPVAEPLSGLDRIESQPPKDIRVVTEGTAQPLGAPPPVDVLAATNGHATADAQVNRTELTALLLGIVAERTGYPAEMLDLDLDLEASLGIDSIKRVEILGQLRQALTALGWNEQDLAMDELSGLKTLHSIIELIAGSKQQGVAQAGTPSSGRATATSNGKADDAVDEGKPSAAAPPGMADSPAPRHENGLQNVTGMVIERFTVRAVERRLPPERKELAPGRVILITDDETGVAQQIAGRLQQDGHPVALLRASTEQATLPPGVYGVDLQSAEKIEDLVGRIRNERGPLAALIHLLPLRVQVPFEEMSFQAWRERLASEARSLFLLGKAVRQDLEAAAEAGGAAVIGATGMGGVFGSGDLIPDAAGSFPGAGAVAGVLKTLAIEWPTVRVKAVDLHLTEGTAALAEHLLAELLAGDSQSEVGWRGSQRLVLEPVPSALPESVAYDIESEWVLLITGGARGITADVALELAERYHATLVLAGRSPLPPRDEQADTAGLTTPQELKAALIARLRSQGQTATPALVEKAYHQLLNEREIRENVRALERAGARVHYYSVDVRDEVEFGKLIDEIYRSFGRLDGVIHGAGIIEDKLVKDKAVESFDRVFGTKADSAFVLSRHLRPDSLRFLVFFSSVSGRFGNRGQADYAAANEVLNKLAIYLDQRWPSRVVAINWGPWDKLGMVSPELQQEFARRGVALIPPLVGRRMLDSEIRHGTKDVAEVIVAGATKLSGAPTPRLASAYPLLEGFEVKASASGVELRRTVDPARDLFLRDHQLDGKPVFPFAMALELMAEVVQEAWPDLKVVGLRDMQLFKGLVVEHGPKDVRVAARAATDPPSDRIGADVIVEITDAERPNLRYYRVTVELADRMPEAPRYQAPALRGFQPFPLSVEEAYHQWLFHGPIFAGISEIEGIAEQGIMAALAPSSPRRCLNRVDEGEWLIDPVVFDSGLQLVILWTRAYLDMTPLPARFRRYHRFGSLSASRIDCYMEVPKPPEENIFTINIYFVDSEGRLVGLLEDMECPSSKALNRLAGVAAAD